MTRCRAVQYSDQMQCGKCGLSWDVNDPDPPQCAPDVAGASPQAEQVLRQFETPADAVTVAGELVRQWTEADNNLKRAKAIINEIAGLPNNANYNLGGLKLPVSVIKEYANYQKNNAKSVINKISRKIA